MANLKKVFGSKAVKMPSEEEFKLLAILSHHSGISGRECAKYYQQEANQEIPYGSLYTTLSRLVETGLIMKFRGDFQFRG